jgi:DNA-binding PadR family transcriptional regulator
MKAEESKVKPMVKIKRWCENYPAERPPRFLRAFMLYILTQSPKHGFKIIEALQDMGIKYEDVGDFGYIYKTLNAMEKDQLVISSCDINDKGRGNYKKIYTLTDKGKAELKLWILSLTNLKESLESFLQACKNIDKENL